MRVYTSITLLTHQNNQTIMKKVRILSIATVVSVALLMSSCGQTKTQQDETANAEDTTVENDGPEMDLLTVDTAQSELKWTGEMLGLYSHYGTIAVKEGFLKMEEGKIVEGTIIIDMTSINPQDDGYSDKEGRRAQDLVGHLSSPDFFNVAKHPEAGFVINNVEGNTATGTLNIRGNKGEETVENVQINKTDNGYEITGDVTFNRKDYGAMFDMPVADKVLSDDIKIEVKLRAS